MSSGAADEQLVAAHAAGDPEAFAELFRRHRDALWAVALRMTGNPEDAADALQDAMLSALRATHTFQRRSSVRTWLYRIVVNACLDRMRRSSARPTGPLAGHDPADPRQDPSRVALRLDLARALADLAPGQRAAVVLVDAHGLPVAEVAEILEVPIGTVKSRCARARAHLADILGDRYRSGGAPGPAAPLRGPAAPAGNPRRARRVQPDSDPFRDGREEAGWR